MVRRLFVSVVLAMLTVLAIGGQYGGEGPVILKVTATHGLHRTDVGVIALALVGGVVLWT